MSVEVGASQRPLSLSLNDAGPIISVVVGATFVASIVFDMGFLTALGMWFDDVPSTLADHTRAALIWLPSIGLGLALGGAHTAFANRVWGPEPPPTSRWNAFGRHLPFYAMILLMVVAVVLHGEAAAGAGSVLGAVLWMELFSWSARRFARPLSPRTFAIFLAFPAVLIFIFFVGWNSAVTRASRNTQTATIHIDASHNEIVRVVRMYERGILYRHLDSVVFVEWDLVRQIGSPLRQMRYGYWCKFYPCPSGNPPFAEPLPSNAPDPTTP